MLDMVQGVREYVGKAVIDSVWQQRVAWEMLCHCQAAAPARYFVAVRSAHKMPNRVARLSRNGCRCSAPVGQPAVRHTGHRNAPCHRQVYHKRGKLQQDLPACCQPSAAGAVP